MIHKSTNKLFNSVPTQNPPQCYYFLSIKEITYPSFFFFSNLLSKIYMNVF